MHRSQSTPMSSDNKIWAQSAAALIIGLVAVYGISAYFQQATWWMKSLVLVSLFLPSAAVALRSSSNGFRRAIFLAVPFWSLVVGEDVMRMLASQHSDLPPLERLALVSEFALSVATVSVIPGGLIGLWIRRHSTARASD